MKDSFHKTDSKIKRLSEEYRKKRLLKKVTEEVDLNDLLNKYNEEGLEEFVLNYDAEKYWYGAIIAFNEKTFSKIKEILKKKGLTAKEIEKLVKKLLALQEKNYFQDNSGNQTPKALLERELKETLLSDVSKIEEKNFLIENNLNETDLINLTTEQKQSIQKNVEAYFTEVTNIILSSSSISWGNLPEGVLPTVGGAPEKIQKDFISQVFYEAIQNNFSEDDLLQLIQDQKAYNGLNPYFDPEEKYALPLVKIDEKNELIFDKQYLSSIVESFKQKRKIVSSESSTAVSKRLRNSIEELEINLINQEKRNTKKITTLPGDEATLESDSKEPEAQGSQKASHNDNPALYQEGSPPIQNTDSQNTTKTKHSDENPEVHQTVTNILNEFIEESNYFQISPLNDKLIGNFRDGNLSEAGKNAQDNEDKIKIIPTQDQDNAYLIQEDNEGNSKIIYQQPIPKNEFEVQQFVNALTRSKEITEQINETKEQIISDVVKQEIRNISESSNFFGQFNSVNNINELNNKVTNLEGVIENRIKNEINNSEQYFQNYTNSVASKNEKEIIMKFFDRVIETEKAGNQSNTFIPEAIAKELNTNNIYDNSEKTTILNTYFRDSFERETIIKAFNNNSTSESTKGSKIRDLADLIGDKTGNSGSIIEENIIEEYKSISRSIIKEEIDSFERKITQITRAENIVESILSTDEAYYRLANNFISFMKRYSF